jgi:hypothetical protein
MFGLLVIFGQIWGEPWNGKNSCFLKGFTTGPHHIQLTRGDFLPVPGPIVAQWQRRARLDLVDKPQRACRRQGQTQCVRPHDALPFAAVILPQTREGVGVTDGNFHGPAVAILAHDIFRTSDSRKSLNLLKINDLRFWHFVNIKPIESMRYAVLGTKDTDDFNLTH